jgi:hypothetical protein
MREIVINLGDQFGGVSEELRFDTLFEEIGMLDRTLRQHETATCRDLDAASRLQIAIDLAQEAEVDFRRDDALRVVETERLVLKHMQVLVIAGMHPFVAVTAHGDLVPASSDLAQHAIALWFVAADKTHGCAPAATLGGVQRQRLVCVGIVRVPDE